MIVHLQSFLSKLKLVSVDADRCRTWVTSCVDAAVECVTTVCQWPRECMARERMCLLAAYLPWDSCLIIRNISGHCSAETFTSRLLFVTLCDNPVLLTHAPDTAGSEHSSSGLHVKTNVWGERSGSFYISDSKWTRPQLLTGLSIVLSFIFLHFFFVYHEV